MAEKTQEYAKELLLRLMEEISEDHYCAGWMHDLEFSLWRMTQGGPTAYGMYPVEPEIVERLRTLSADAGGWFRFVGKGLDSGPAFIATDEWLPIYRTYADDYRAKGYCKIEPGEADHA